MIHNVYMLDHTPICEEPARLDFGEFVTQEQSSNPERICPECSQLLAVANKRAYEREMYGGLSIVQKNPAYEVDPSWDKFVTGLMLGSAFWVTILIIIWAVFLRCQ